MVLAVRTRTVNPADCFFFGSVRRRGCPLRCLFLCFLTRAPPPMASMAVCFCFPPLPTLSPLITACLPCYLQARRQCPPQSAAVRRLAGANLPVTGSVEDHYGTLDGVSLSMAGAPTSRCRTDWGHNRERARRRAARNPLVQMLSMLDLRTMMQCAAGAACPRPPLAWRVSPHGRPRTRRGQPSGGRPCMLAAGGRGRRPQREAKARDTCPVEGGGSDRKRSDRGTHGR